MEHEDRFKRSTGPVISAATFFIGLIAVIFLCLINFWIIQFICHMNSRLKKERNERTQYARYTNLSPTSKSFSTRDCGPDYYKAIKNENQIDEDFQKIVRKYTKEKRNDKAQPQ